jgi:hypothetical protein
VYYRTLHQNYSKTRYWKEYAAPLEELFFRPWTHLVDLNLALIDFLWTAFSIPTPTLRASALHPGGKKSDLLLDLCRKTGATEYLSGPSGKDYLDETIFAAEGITVRYHAFRHPDYSQAFSPFVPGMASVDLLFNEGPDGIRRLD